MQGGGRTRNAKCYQIVFSLASLAIDLKPVLIEIGPNMLKMTNTLTVKTFNDFLPPPHPHLNKVHAHP